MTILVRFARRKAAWEDDRPVEELQQVEFRRKDGSPDLKPSVYLLPDDDASFTRAYAEHTATPPITPERSTIGIKATECFELILETPGSPRFSFIRESHREFDVDSLESLLTLVHRLRERVREGRRREVTRAGCIAYGRERVAVLDPEWKAVAEAGEADWLKALRRFIPAP